MDKNEFRAVIKHFWMDGKTATEIRDILQKVHGTSTPSFSTISFWVSEFKRGRTSTKDEPRSGRPKTATNEEMVDKVHDLVLADRRVKLREIVETTGISYERVQNIVHEHLGMRKLSARWVPRLLTMDNKRNRVTTSKECLALLNRNPTDFFRRFVTVDETWIHHYTPETKQQSKQWISPGESAPKKAKTVPSAGKVMATVFWDSQGVIHIDFLQKGRTITGQYYSDLLDQFNGILKEKRPHLQRKKVLFHHDNAPAHSSRIANAKLVELGYEVVPHPPYSPDLAPCDFFLFTNMKTWLGGKRFTSNEEVIAATKAYFAEFPKSYFSEGLKKLEHRWEKCIALQGYYVEK